uniref:Uncharacterized protein n=1 Tax=Panagrolaimus superbus TaxID=310955 RepID=A0A914Z0N6_9BILA
MEAINNKRNLHEQLKKKRHTLGIKKWDYRKNAGVPIIKIYFNNLVEMDISASGTDALISGQFIETLMKRRPDIALIIRKIKQLFIDFNLYGAQFGNFNGCSINIWVICALQNINDLAIFSASEFHKREGYWDLVGNSCKNDFDDFVVAGKIIAVLQFMKKTQLTGRLAVDDPYKQQQQLFIESPVTRYICSRAFRNKMETLCGINNMLKLLNKDIMSLIGAPYALTTEDEYIPPIPQQQYLHQSHRQAQHKHHHYHEDQYAFEVPNQQYYQNRRSLAPEQYFQQDNGYESLHSAIVHDSSPCYEQQQQQQQSTSAFPASAYHSADYRNPADYRQRQKSAMEYEVDAIISQIDIIMTVIDDQLNLINLGKGLAAAGLPNEPKYVHGLGIDNWRDFIYWYLSEKYIYEEFEYGQFICKK